MWSADILRIKIGEKMASYDYDTNWWEMKRQQWREMDDHAPFVVTQPIVVEPMLLSGK